MKENGVHQNTGPAEGNGSPLPPASTKALRKQASFAGWYSWLLFLLFALAYIQVSVHRTGVSTLALDIMRDLSIGGGTMTLIASGYFYAYGVMQVPAGMLADRWGGRRTVSCFLALGALGSLLFGLATSPGLAVLGRICVGVGMGMVFIPALRVVLGRFPQEKHSLMTGLLLSSGPAGMLLATMPLVWLGNFMGWRGVMLSMAAVSGATALVIVLVVRDAPLTSSPKDAAPMRAGDLWASIKLVARNRMYQVSAVWFFCTPSLYFSITGLWASPYFIQAYGLTPQQAGQALFSLALGGMLAPSLMAALAMRVALPKRIYLAIASLGTILLALPLIVPSPVVPIDLLPFWTFALGFMSGGFPGIGLSNIQEHFPPELMGTAMGMTNVFLFAGVTVLQIISGWVMEWQAPATSDYSIEHYAVMFLVFVAVQIPAGLGMLLPQKKPGPFQS